MKISPQRDLFDIPEGVAYLNCAYMAPTLRAARRAAEEALERTSHPWQITPPDYFTGCEEVRSLFARLIGGDPDGVAIVPSVSYGMAVAAANVPVERGEKIVVLEEEFPSGYYCWRELARRKGARLSVVRRPPDGDWTSAVLEEIDESTAVVVATNCHWTDGTLLDLVKVGGEARSVGAALVVDGIQSLGAMPFDVGKVRPAFLATASYKWLLGPYGVGFLWVSEEYRSGTPIEHNWINRAGSERFSHLVDYRDDFQPGARRYDAGERSNFVLLPMVAEALRQILSWGVGNIAETLASITALIEEEAVERGMEPTPSALRAPHMLGIRLETPIPEDLPAQLASRGVHVSVRGDSLRISPHLYNTGEDVSLLFSVLEEHTRARSV